MFIDIAASSTWTEGSLPRVYDAVNSHGNPDLKHSAQGHLPLHLVFFLSSRQNNMYHTCSNLTLINGSVDAFGQALPDANLLLTPITRSTNASPLSLFSPPLQWWRPLIACSSIVGRCIVTFRSSLGSISRGPFRGCLVCFRCGIRCLFMITIHG